MSTYPAIAIAVRNRTLLKFLCPAAVFGAALYLAWRISMPEIAVVGAIAAVVTYLVLALVLDVLKLIFETLVPQI